MHSFFETDKQPLSIIVLAVLHICIIVPFSRQYRIDTIIPGGELIVHIHTETPGNIIKQARQSSGITMEELADRIGITTRYLYRIENEGKSPATKFCTN